MRDGEFTREQQPGNVAMASLEHDADSRRFLVRFRYGDREYKRSLKTCDRREAVSILGRIQETITLIERGRMTMPHDVDPATFILSDGKRKSHRTHAD